MSSPLLHVEQLTLHFPVRRGLLHRTRAYVHAVDGVSFTLRAGETLGLVGESGCGKSTLAKALMQLIPIHHGQVTLNGETLHRGANHAAQKAWRRQLQMVFQDPYESLNPRHTVEQILLEPFEIHRLGNPAQRQQWIRELLVQVGLPEAALSRYPHEFSGGQRQRIGIARALALDPQVMICDEAVSALDVSVQAQILNLLLELQRQRNLAMLFIAHDLAVVKHMSDRVAVMYLGQIVELADSEPIYRRAAHPYTRALLAAIPQPDPDQATPMKAIQGEIPSPIDPPSGCRFHPRCPHVTDLCRQEMPVLRELEPGHWVACHHAEQHLADE